MEKLKKSSRGRTPEGNPNPVDIHVGNRIRIRRQQLGLSQEKLATLLGLTFQQVQKYERGMNRVGASRLWDLGKIMDVEINYFYANMDELTVNQSPRQLSLSQLDLEDLLPIDEIYDPMQDSKIIEMVTSFTRIKNPGIQAHIQALINLSAHSTTWNNKQEEEENNELEAAE